VKTLRGIVAVVVGYFIFAISAVMLFKLTGHNAHAPASVPFMIATTIYGMVFAALGGAASVVIAPTRDVIYARIVSSLIALGAAASLVLSPSTDARWSMIASLLFMAPMAIIGGVIIARRPRA
jgi:hypothetical protein